jgi:anti-sigma regulatory factor (Ser/Thr protein kinase)
MRLAMTPADGQTRTFQATAEGISAADAWVEQVGRSWGIPERTAFGARICIAEIAANVREHGAAPAQAIELGVTLCRRGSGLEVEITDSGAPFDPTAVSERPLPQNLDEAEVGGLGLRLVRSYASDITYRHDGICNRLKLHLPASQSPRTAA